MNPFDALDRRCCQSMTDADFQSLPFFQRRRLLRTIVRCANDNWEEFEAQYEADPKVAVVVLGNAIEDQMREEYSSILAVILLTVVLAAISAVVQWLIQRWLDRHKGAMNFAEFEGADCEPE